MHGVMTPFRTEQDGPAELVSLEHDWLDLIRSEYSEMPGLSLNLRQASRLWNLPPGVCEQLLTDLIADRFLRRTREGRYVRT